MSIVDTAVNTTKNEEAYNLMDKAIKVENKLANTAEEKHNPQRFAKESESEKKVAWMSANDTFNDIRDFYGLKSYQEAVDDANFALRTSSNSNIRYYAQKDLRDLEQKNAKGARYVAPSNMSNHIVPASADNDILPFLKAVEKNDSVFKNMMNN